jgi:hypothetical protein
MVNNMRSTVNDQSQWSTVNIQQPAAVGGSCSKHSKCRFGRCHVVGGLPSWETLKWDRVVSPCRTRARTVPHRRSVHMSNAVLPAYPTQENPAVIRHTPPCPQWFLLLLVVVVGGGGWYVKLSLHWPATVCICSFTIAGHMFHTAGPGHVINCSPQPFKLPVSAEVEMRTEYMVYYDRTRTTPKDATQLPQHAL